MTSSNIEIEEVLGDDSPVDTPDPIITEQDELSEVSNNKQADMITEVTLACKLVNNICKTLIIFQLNNFFVYCNSGQIKYNCQI